MANQNLIVRDYDSVGLVELSQGFDNTLKHPYYRYILSQTPNSRATVQSTLRRLSVLLFKHDQPECAKWETVTAITMDLLIEKLRSLRYSPKTCQRYLAVLRGILDKAREVGLIEPNEFENIRKIKGRFGSKLTKGRSLSNEEIDSVFASLRKDKSIYGVRDTAIIAIYVGCGIRRAELASLLLSDVNFKEQFFVVNGKGSKERVVPMPPGLDKLVFRWINEIRGDTAGPLFGSIQRTLEDFNRDENGRIKPLSLRRINDMITRRLSILDTPATTHDLRRTFAERRLEQGGNIKTLQDLLGHVNMSTTGIYLKSKKRAFESAQKDTLFQWKGMMISK